jgi:hypothetical protein
MEKVKSTDKYDFYIGIIDGATVYNIVPKGSNIPNGGYKNKKWIEAIKHTYF